jgi:peptide/nickel transport system substrate-binding protein
MIRKEKTVKEMALCWAIFLATQMTSLAFASETPRLIALIDQPPTTLNPRMTLDASGQRINALLFAALTRMGPSLEVLPDLATRWSHKDSYRRWVFQIHPGATDHSGRPITAQDLIQCFSQYSSGKPRALAVQALPEIKKISATKDTLTFELLRGDPWFSRNVTLLRYFRQEGQTPCSDPKPEKPIIASGSFRAQPFSLTPTNELNLERRTPQGSFEPAGRLLIIRDETTRTLRLLRGEASIVQNGFSPQRTRWLHNRHPERFHLVEAPGVNVSYLAFNLRDPFLKNLRVRRALAMAIPVDSIIQNRLARMADPATSFLAPFLPEAHSPARIPYDPAQATQLLDEAGFLRDPQTGWRQGLKLSFKTTPIREGQEIVRIIQDAWKKIGIQLQIEVVEQAVFLASVRRGAFQLSLGRWIGVADASILERSLRSGSSSNRSGYSNSKVDALLDLVAAESNPSRRHIAMQELQEQMMLDLPYFPLWFWKNAVLYTKTLGSLSPHQLSRSGALAPLFQVH